LPGPALIVPKNRPGAGSLGLAHSVAHAPDVIAHAQIIAAGP
jgi:hypothetical protein